MIKNKYPQRKRNIILKVVSALTAFTFIFHDIASFASIDLSLPSKLDPKSLSVPQDIGIVKETQFAPGSDVIINIKDVHDNYGAQESIAQILENLVVNYNVRTIGMEGAEGFVDTSLLAALPDEDMRLKTASFMMQEGKLSAGQFFSAMTGGRVAVYGMDDEKLYEENLQAFKNNLKNKSKNYQAVGRLRRALSLLEDALYSPEMIDLNKNGVLNHNGNVRFGDRWQEISGLADKLGVDYRGYAPIQNLLKVMALEKKIDFKAVNTEREALLDILSKRVDRPTLEKVVLESVNYKMGKISQGSFSSFILDTAQKTNVSVEAYKNLLRYAEYMLIYEALDIDALKDSIQSLESGIREKIFRSSEERQLYALTRQCDILMDLFEVKLSSSSLDYFKKKGSEFKPEAFKKFITEQSARHHIAVDPALDVDAVFDRISEAMKFYESAEKRNQAILANTVRRMRSDGKNVACLVTGGFHTRGITELMKQNQTSYVVILPRFSKKTTRPYLTLITNNQSSYKEFADSEYALIAKHEITAHFFAQAIFKALPANSPESAQGKNLIAQKEVERMKMLYLNSFRALKRSLVERGLLKEGVEVPLAVAGVPVSAAAGGKVTRGTQSSPVDAQMIMDRALLLGDVVIEGMKVAYVDERVYVLFSAVSGKKYLYVLNRLQDGTVEFTSRTQGAEAESDFTRNQSLVEGVQASEERAPVSVAQRLAELARTLANQGLDKNKQVSVDELRKAARTKGIAASITDVQGVLANLERDSALSKKDVERGEISETERKTAALESLEALKAPAVLGLFSAKPGSNEQQSELDMINSFFSGSRLTGSLWKSLAAQDATTIEAFVWVIRQLAASPETDERRRVLTEFLSTKSAGHDILFEKMIVLYRTKTQLSQNPSATLAEIKYRLIDSVTKEAGERAILPFVAQKTAEAPAEEKAEADKKTAPTDKETEAGKEGKAAPDESVDPAEVEAEKQLEEAEAKLEDAKNDFIGAVSRISAELEASEKGHLAVARKEIDQWIEAKVIKQVEISQATGLYRDLAKLDLEVFELLISDFNFGKSNELIYEQVRVYLNQAVPLAQANKNLKDQKSEAALFQRDQAFLNFDQGRKIKLHPELAPFLDRLYSIGDAALVSEFWVVFDSTVEGRERNLLIKNISKFSKAHPDSLDSESIRQELLSPTKRIQEGISNNRQNKEARSKQEEAKKTADAEKARLQIISKFNELTKNHQTLRTKLLEQYHLSLGDRMNTKELERLVRRLDKVGPEMRELLLDRASKLDRLDKNDFNELLLLSIGWAQAIKIADNPSEAAMNRFTHLLYNSSFGEMNETIEGEENAVREAANRVIDRSEKRILFLLDVKMKAAQHDLRMGPVLEVLGIEVETDFIEEVGNYLSGIKEDAIGRERFVADALSALGSAAGRKNLQTALKLLMSQEAARKNLEKKLSQKQGEEAIFSDAIQGLILGDRSLVDAFNRLDETSLIATKENIQYFTGDVDTLRSFAKRLHKIQSARAKVTLLEALDTAPSLDEIYAGESIRSEIAQRKRELAAAKEQLASFEVRLENWINQKKIEARRDRDAALLKEFGQLIGRLYPGQMSLAGEVREKLFALYLRLVESKQDTLKADLIRGVKKILDEQEQYQFNPRGLAQRVFYFVVEKTGEPSASQKAEADFNEALKRFTERNRDFVGEAEGQVSEADWSEFLRKVNEIVENDLNFQAGTALLNRLTGMDAYLLVGLINDLGKNFDRYDLEIFEGRYQKLQANTALVRALETIRRTENRIKGNEKGNKEGAPDGSEAFKKIIADANTRIDLVMAGFREEIRVYRARRETARKAGIEDEFDDIAQNEAAGNVARRTEAWDRMVGAWESLDDVQRAAFKIEIKEMAGKLKDLSASFEEAPALEARMKLTAENTQLLKKIREKAAAADRDTLSPRQKEIFEKKLKGFETESTLEERVRILRSIDALEGPYRAFFFKWAAADLPLTFEQWSVLATKVELIQEGPRRLVQLDRQLDEQRAVLGSYSDLPAEYFFGIEQSLREEREALQRQVIEAPQVLDEMLAQRREAVKAQKLEAVGKTIEAAVARALSENEFGFGDEGPDAASVSKGVVDGLAGVLENTRLQILKFPNVSEGRRAAAPIFRLEVPVGAEKNTGNPIVLNGDVVVATTTELAKEIVAGNITTDAEAASTLASWIQTTAIDIARQNSTLGDEAVLVTMQFVSDAQELAYVQGNVIHLDISLIQALLARSQEGINAPYLSDLLDLLTQHERRHQGLRGLGLDFLAEEREVLKQDAIYFYGQSQEYRTRVMTAIEILRSASYDVDPYLNFLKAINRAAQAAEAQKKREEEAARRAKAPPSKATSRLDLVSEEVLRGLLKDYFQLIKKQDEDLAEIFFQEKLLPVLEVEEKDVNGNITFTGLRTYIDPKDSTVLTGLIDDDNKLKDAYSRFIEKSANKTVVAELEKYANDPAKHPNVEQNLREALTGSQKHLLTVTGFDNRYFARQDILQFFRERHSKITPKLFQDNPAAETEARAKLNKKEIIGKLFITIGSQELLIEVVDKVLAEKDRPKVVEKMQEIAKSGGMEALEAARAVGSLDRQGHMVTIEGQWYHGQAFDAANAEINTILEYQTQIDKYDEQIKALENEKIPQQITLIKEVEARQPSARLDARTIKQGEFVRDRDTQKITRALLILSLGNLLQKFSLKGKTQHGDRQAEAQDTLRQLRVDYGSSVNGVDVDAYNDKLQDAIRDIGLGHRAEMDRIQSHIQKMLAALKLDPNAKDFEKKKQELLSEEADVNQDEFEANNPRSEAKNKDKYSDEAIQKRRLDFIDGRFKFLTEKNGDNQEGRHQLFIGWLTELGVDTSEKRLQRIFQAIREGRVKQAWVDRWLEEMVSMRTELDRLKLLLLVDQNSGFEESKDRQKQRTDLARNLRRGIGRTISIEGILDRSDAIRLSANEEEKAKNIREEAEVEADTKFLLEKATAAWEDVKGITSALFSTFDDLRTRNLEIQSLLEKEFSKTRVLVAMYGIRDVFDESGNVLQGAALLKWAGRVGLIKIEDQEFKDLIDEERVNPNLEKYSGNPRIASMLSEIEGMVNMIKDLSFGSETFFDLWQREKDQFLEKTLKERTAIVEKAVSLGFISEEEWKGATEEEKKKTPARIDFLFNRLLVDFTNEEGKKREKVSNTDKATQLLAAVFEERFRGSIDETTGKINENKVDELTIFVLESVKLAAGWKEGLKPDQLTMLGLFMGYDSAGLLAGGGKTVVYALYHLLARLTGGNNYHGMIIAENADGVNGFTSRPFNAGGATSLQTFFSIFGMRLENGSKMFETHDTEGLSAALTSSNTLLVIDKTARAHVNNNSEEDPKLRRALNHVTVTTVDEVHLFSTDRDAALLSKGTREADLADIENVNKIIEAIWDKSTRKIKDFIMDLEPDGTRLSTGESKSIGQRIIRTEADYRREVAAYRDTDAGKHTMMIFQWDEQVYVTEALETYLQKKLNISSNKIIASTIRGLLKIQDKDKAGGWTTTETKEGDELKTVIAPIGNDGSVKATSIISDIHYQAVLALFIKDWNPEEARKLVRVSDSSTQVAITDALQTDGGTRVMGASGTVQALEELIAATTGSKVVNINASKNQLSTYKPLKSMTEVYQEIENTVRGKRIGSDGVPRGALVAEYDPEKIQKLRDYFTERGIPVRIMGSEADDISDIVEKASNLTKDAQGEDVGTVTIFNQRGMTGRDYKSRKNKDGQAIGLDLFHLGVHDEKTTEILFNQTTARNRRSTSDGERFYLWDEAAQKTVRERLGDLFAPENKELRAEVVAKLQKNVEAIGKTPSFLRSEEEKAFLFIEGKLRVSGPEGLGEYLDYEGDLFEELLSESILSDERIRGKVTAALSKSERDRDPSEKLWASLSKVLSETRSTRSLSDSKFIFEEDLVLRTLGVSSLEKLRESIREDKQRSGEFKTKAENRYQMGMIILNQKYLTIREINESARFMVQDTSYTRFVVEPLKEALRIVRKDKKEGADPSPIEKALQDNLESALRRESDHVQLQLGSTERERGAAYTQGVILSSIQQAEATFRSLKENEHAKELEKMLGMEQKLASLKQARDNILSEDKVWDRELNDREPMTSFAQAKREADGDYYKLVEYTYRVSQYLAREKMISKMGRQSHLIEINRLSEAVANRATAINNGQSIQFSAYGEEEPHDSEEDRSKKQIKKEQKKKPTQKQLEVLQGTVVTTDGFQSRLEKNRSMKEVVRAGSTGLAVLIGDELHGVIRDEHQLKTVFVTKDPSLVRAAQRIMESQESGNGGVFRVQIQNGEGENEGGLNISFTHMPSKIKPNMSFSDLVIMLDINAQVLQRIIGFGAGTPPPIGPDGKPKPQPRPFNVTPDTVRAMAAQLGLSDDELIARVTRGAKAYHSKQNAELLVRDIARDPKKHAEFFKKHAQNIKDAQRAAKGAPDRSEERVIANGWKLLQMGRKPQLGSEEAEILAKSYLRWVTGSDKRVKPELEAIAKYEQFSKEYKQVMEEVLKDTRSIDDPQFYASIEKYFMSIYPEVREAVITQLAKDPKAAEYAEKNEYKKKIEQYYDGEIKAVKDKSDEPEMAQFQIGMLEERKKEELKNMNQEAAVRMLRNQEVDSELLRGILQKINLKDEVVKHMRQSPDKNERLMGDLLQRLRTPGTPVNLVAEFDTKFTGDQAKKIEVWREFQSRALMLGVSPDPLARVSLHLARQVSGVEAADVNLQEDLLQQANQIAKLGRDTALQAEIQQAFVEHLEARGERAISAKREIELRHILGTFEKIQGGSGTLVSNKVISFKNQLQLIISLADPATREFNDNVLVASGFVRSTGWAAISSASTLEDLEKITGYKAEEFQEAINLHYGRIPVGRVSVAKSDTLSEILDKINQKIKEADATNGTQEAPVDMAELIEFVTDVVKVKKALVVAEKLEKGLTRSIIDQGDAMAVELQKIQTLLEKFDVYEDGAERLSNAARHLGSNGFLLREGFRQFGFHAAVASSPSRRSEVLFTHILSEWADREQYHDNSNHDDTMMLVAARNADKELGSLAAQILKNRYAPDAKARAQDFGNIAANLKVFARRDNGIRTRAIDVEAGIDISEGKIFIHTMEIVQSKEKDLTDPLQPDIKLRRTAKTRVLSRIDTAPEDRGNNVSQNNGDGTISHFRSKTAKWNEDESRGVLTGEKERWVARMKEDLERMKKNDPQDPPRFIKITKSGGVDYVSLEATDEFKNVARGLNSIASKAQVTGYRDANPKDRQRLLENLEKVLNTEMEEAQMKRALFNMDLAEGKEFRDRELNVWEFQEYVDGWMNDLDIHEVDGHEVDNVLGRAAYWHKRYKGEEGIKHREIDAHLISIARGKSPHSVLIQPITYISRGSSGIGYSMAGIEILRYIFVNLDSKFQSQIQNTVEQALQDTRKKPDPSDVPFERGKTLFDPDKAKKFMLTEPRAVLAMGSAMRKVPKEFLQAAAEKGYADFMKETEPDVDTGEDISVNQAPQQDELGSFVSGIVEGKSGIDDKTFNKSMLKNPEVQKKIKETIPQIQQIFDEERQYAREHGYGAAVAYLDSQKIKLKVEKYAYRAVKEGYQFVRAQVRGELHTLSEMLKRSPDQSRLMNYVAAKNLLPKDYLKFEQEANENKAKAIERIRPYLTRAGIPESMVSTYLSENTRAFLSKSAYREVPFYVEGKSVDKGSTAAYSFDSFELVVVATDDEPSNNSIAEYRHVLNHEIQHFNIDIANEKIREAIVELISLLNNRHRGVESEQYQDVLRRLAAQEGEYRMFMDFAKKHFKGLSYETLVYAQMTGDLSVLGLYSLEAAIATIGFEAEKTGGKIKLRSSFNFEKQVLSPNRGNRLTLISLEDLRKVPDENGQELAKVVFSIESDGKGNVTLKHVQGKPTYVKEKGRKKDEVTTPQVIKEAQKPIRNLAVPPPPKDEDATPEGEAALPAWTQEKVVVRFGQQLNFLTPATDVVFDDVHQIGQVHARGLTPDKQAEMDGLLGPRASGESWYLLFDTNIALGVTEKPIAVAKIKRKPVTGRINPNIQVQPIADGRGNSLSVDQIKTALTHPVARGNFKNYLSDPLGQAEIVLDQTAALLFQELQEKVKARSDSAAKINEWYKARAREIFEEIMKRDSLGFELEDIVFPAENADTGNQLDPVAVNISGPRGATHGLITGDHAVGKDENGKNVDGPFKFDGPIGAIVKKQDKATGKIQRWVVISDNTLQVILGEPTREDRAMSFLTQEAMRVQETAIRQRGTLAEGDKALSDFAEKNNIGIIYEGRLQNHKEKRVLLPDKQYPDTAEGRRQQKADELRAMHGEGEDEDDGTDNNRTSKVEAGESFSIEPFLVSGKDVSVKDRIVYWTESPKGPVYLAESQVDLSDPKNLRNKATGEKVNRWVTHESNARNAYTAEKTYRVVRNDKNELQIIDAVSVAIKDLDVKPIAPVAARLAGETQAVSLPQPAPKPTAVTFSPITAFVVLPDDEDRQATLAGLTSKLQGARLAAVSSVDEAKALAEAQARTGVSQAALVVDIKPTPGQTPEARQGELFEALKGGIKAIREKSQLSLEVISPRFKNKTPAQISVLLDEMSDDELERIVEAVLKALQDTPFEQVDWETLFEGTSPSAFGGIQTRVDARRTSYDLAQTTYANRLAGLAIQLFEKQAYIPPVYLAPATNAFVPGTRQLDSAFFGLVSNPNLRLKNAIYFYSYDREEALLLQQQLDARGLTQAKVLDISGTQKENLVVVVRERIENPDNRPLALLIPRAEAGAQTIRYANITQNTPDRFIFIPVARLAPAQAFGLALISLLKEKSVLFIQTSPTEEIPAEVLAQYPWLLPIALPLHLFEELRQAIANLRPTEAAA